MFPMLAQNAPVVGVPQHSIGAMVIAVIAVSGVFMIAPLVLFIRNGQQRREWEHAERMLALKQGLPVPPRDAPWARAAVCIAIGAGVPLVAFLFTSLNSIENRDSAIWIAPALVSGASVVAASILAGLMFRGGSRRDARQVGADVKPTYDPDALDVVGRRG